MPDNHTPEQRHANMAAIHSSNTIPEVTLRRVLWRKGFRYRINDKRLPGKPDIVLPKYRTVIFIHGCFWHGHDGCNGYTVPKTNTEFWTAKITRNKERDQETWRQLEAKGWAVIIVWECQLKKVVLQDTVEAVTGEIVRNGEILRATQDDRRKAREEYQKEQRERRERETNLKDELQEKFPRK